MTPPTADEPTPWELQRSLDRLRQDLSDAITRAEKHLTTESLQSILGRYDDHLKALNEDIAQERGMRQADVTGARDWGKSEHDRLEVWVREAVERLEKASRDAKDREKDREREARADRRVMWGAAAAGVVSIVLWILDRMQGAGS